MVNMKLVILFSFLQICIVHSIQPEPSLVEPPTQFQFLTTSKTFIDKTMFIKNFIDTSDDKNHNLITCPQKFGKSVTVEMVKLFVEIYPEALGTSYDRKDTDNYRLFTNPNLTLQISQYDDFIEQHLGLYPVIYVDFEKIVEMPDARQYDKLMRKIGRLLRCSLFSPYLFLYKRLKKRKCSTDQQTLRIRNELESFLAMYHKEYLNEEDIVECFNLVASLLHEYFGKKIVLLIDHYDIPVKEAILYDMDVRRIYQILFDAYSKSLENDHVGHALFTGTLEMSMPRTVKHCRFLDNHKFAQHYGLSVDELNTLHERLDPDDYPYYEEEKNDIEEYYKRYLIRNTLTPVYNLFELINHHKDRYLHYSWSIGINLIGIRSFLRSPIIRAETSQLLSNNQVHVKLLDNITIDDLCTYQDIVLRRIDIIEPKYVRFYHTCLFINGYLTHTDRENVYRLLNGGVEKLLRNWMTSTADRITRITISG